MWFGMRCYVSSLEEGDTINSGFFFTSSPSGDDAGQKTKLMPTPRGVKYRLSKRTIRYFFTSSAAGDDAGQKGVCSSDSNSSRQFRWF